MMRRIVFLTLATLMAAVAGAATTFNGRVVDPTDAPVPSARVEIFATNATQPVATAASDRTGQFSLALEPGDYLVRIASARFVDVVESISVDTKEAAPHTFAFQVPAVRDTIIVHAPAGYTQNATSSGTKTLTPLRDVPQAVTVVTHQLMQDQLMSGVADVVRYVPGVQMHQGENNRDQVVIRGNSSSADFFVDGVRDDVQYYRDLYNLDRVEALKGPNAMIFGRGGAGGVINRVTKEAGFTPLRELLIQRGAFDNTRATLDYDDPLNETLAFRLNGVYENSGSFRNHVERKRAGFAPSLTFLPDSTTKVTINLEHFRDRRVADRGMTSFRGLPVDLPIDTYFGNPNDSHVRASVDLASALVEHSFGAISFRNRTSLGDYDRGYQNYVPGAVSADKSRVTLTAYNNATKRKNLFNQTDVTYIANALGVKQTLLAGAEIGRQLTDNFRNTGFFNNSATSITVPYLNPETTVPVTFRQSATDADNHLVTSVAAVYAQDQLELSPHVQLIAGLRFDRFDLQFHNNRNGDDLARADNLLSPRLGVVVKPVDALSLYASSSVSYVPSSGDQFSSLTTITEQVKPEKLNNLEIGAKWDATNSLAFTAAAYRLDRTNTRSTDPSDPTRIVQTGSQRTNGVELGINGTITSRWSIAGGYAYQDAYVTSATTAARAGAQVAQVPHHTISLWNNVQLHPRVNAAVGIVHRSAMFAAIDNSVRLPGYNELDAAAYVSLVNGVRIQVNVENLLDKKYWANADSNTNISPGSPRAVRLALVTRF